MNDPAILWKRLVLRYFTEYDNVIELFTALLQKTYSSSTSKG